MSEDRSMLKGAACASGIAPPKPKRPLTIFNLFSILERNFIVQQNQKRASASSNAPEETNANHVDPYLATRPERYRDVVLPPNWYVVGMNRVKRSKHEVHGVISFNDLTKEISNRWKSVDAKTKQYCKMIAADELERYQRDMAEYEAKYGKDAVKAQKRKCDSQSNKNIIAQNNQLLKSDGIPVCTNNAMASQFREAVAGLATFVARRDIPSQATAPQHWYACNPVPAQPDRGKSDENYQSTNSGAWSTCKPIGGQTKTNNVGEDNHSTNSAQGSGHSPTLSEYLPDDQEAALALVGNNYDNILHGEELEKAFDSD
ncbi:hypothetical protein ACHAW6_009806 [Cyclotella cf. meneghiniana]